MKRLPLILAGLSVACVSTTALADPTPAKPAPPAAQTINVVITARAPMPQIVVLLQHPTAASVADAAHERMREEWLERSVPAAMRAGK
jgi:hypothetical protein